MHYDRKPEHTSWHHFGFNPQTLEATIASEETSGFTMTDFTK